MDWALVGLMTVVFTAVIAFLYGMSGRGVFRGHPTRAGVFMATIIAVFLIESIVNQKWVHTAIWGTLALAHGTSWWWRRTASHR